MKDFVSLPDHFQNRTEGSLSSGGASPKSVLQQETSMKIKNLLAMSEKTLKTNDSVAH